MTQIAILQQSGQFFPGGYLLSALVDAWRAGGERVDITSDPAVAARAEVAINHVDLTVIPAAQLAALNNCPVVINRHVLDISKRRVSRNLLAGPGDYDGPVIVKSDANGMGNIERKRRRATGMSAWLVASFRKHFLPWYKSGYFGPGGYRIFASPNDVPAAVWSNPWFVVERFRPEFRDNKYVLRTWVFFGDRDIHLEAYGSDPFVKAGNALGHDALGDVPKTLKAARQEFKFDYGKFDYVMSDGEAVLLDINRTPTAGLTSDRVREYGEHLASGLDWFFVRRKAAS